MKIKISTIRRDGGTQARDGLNSKTVKEYVDVIRDHQEETGKKTAWPFRDPVIVFYDGQDKWLADGFHRVEACHECGLQNVEADIRPGTRRDAILHAAGANADHGLPRSAADKYRAVAMLLNDPEWAQWSDREIARRAKVSPTFVGKVRENTIAPVASDERVYTDKHGNQATMKTAKIGATKLTKQQYIDQVLRPAVRDFCPRYTDEFNRSWSSIENPAHTNGTFWRQITKEFKAAGIAYNEADLKLAIKSEIDQMTRELLARQEAARPVNPYMREDRPFDPEPPTTCPKQSCRHDFTKEPPEKLGINHWRCPNCGREMDSNGRLPKQQNVPGEDDVLPEVADTTPTDQAPDLVQQCVTAVKAYAASSNIPLADVATNMLHHARYFDPGRVYLMDHLDAAAKLLTNGNGNAYTVGNGGAYPQLITDENREKMMIDWTPRLWCPACHQQGIVWAPAGGYGRCSCGNVVWTDGTKFKTKQIRYEKQNA
ncbi:MAG: hypothetical protein KC441_17490 [Anaerolineales bacterium]|nr:hypothetical protein [Anaerolineales bacterium]